MKAIDYVLFDFDGTICDTAPGIYNSMQKVVEHYHLPYGRDTFKKMIGPSLKESFTTIFHLPQSEVDNAIKVYRAYYSKEGMFQCEPYDGVINLIQTLRSMGKKILVATSKPEVYTKQIIEQKGLSFLFDFIGGADISEKKRCEKIEVINYVLEKNKITDKKSSCIMIGDRNYDVKGAHMAGLEAIGILWGFGNREEFEQCGADYICEKPDDVLKLIKE